MKVQYASDLHLEFESNRDFLKANPLQPVGDILILAGDICLLNSLGQHHRFFDYVSSNWKYCYWVPGNHEYYYANVADYSDSFCEAIRNNVYLVNNYSVIHDEITFIFSTLWSYVSQLNEKILSSNVSDFHVIQYQNRRLTVADFNRLHHKAVAFMEEAFINSPGKTIVTTHHVPTLKNYPPEYLNSAINNAFVSDLDELILSSNAKFWIYGHHHCNIPPFNIGNTSLVTNQLGYVKHGEQKGFYTAAVLPV